MKAYKPSKQHILVRWQPPPKGRYKLNTNGFRSEDGAIGVGELSKITLVPGLVASLQTWALQAKLLALYHGVVLVCHKE